MHAREATGRSVYGGIKTFHKWLAKANGDAEQTPVVQRQIGRVGPVERQPAQQGEGREAQAAEAVQAHATSDVQAEARHAVESRSVLRSRQRPKLLRLCRELGSNPFQSEHDVVEVVVSEAVIATVSTTVWQRFDNHRSTVMP